MRVIAGEFKGRRLKFIKHDQLRPTMDRVKESMFNVLGGYLEPGRVLDLFAGCGSLGIEALSRGAGEIYFVDSSREALGVLRENLETLRVPASRYKILRATWKSALQQLKRGGTSFDLVLIDPPYNKSGLIENALMELGGFDILRPSARIVAEHSSRYSVEDSALPEGIEKVKVLRFGGTTLTFIRRKS